MFLYQKVVYTASFGFSVRVNPYYYYNLITSQKKEWLKQQSHRKYFKNYSSLYSDKCLHVYRLMCL